MVIDVDRGTREDLLDRPAEAVGSVTVAHPTRVAIHGPPAAGKTPSPTSWPSAGKMSKPRVSPVANARPQKVSY